MKLLRSFFDGSRPSSGRFFQTAFVTYAGMGLSLVSAPLLARTLGPDGRGVLAGAFVSVQVLSWVAFLGLPRGLALQDHKRAFMSGVGVLVVAGLGPISALLAFLSADILSNGDERISLGIRIAAGVLVFSGIGQIGLELVLVSGRIWPFNLIRASTLVFPSLAYIVLWASGTLTLEIAFIVTLAGNALGNLIGCVFAISGIRRSNRTPVPWNFSLRFWSTSAFDSVGGRLDQLLLSALSPASVLGMYAVAITCASASGGLTQALNHVTYSKFASALNASTDNGALLRKRTTSGALLSVIVAVPVVTLVYFFGETLFGVGYHGLALVTAILVVAQFLNDQWQLRVYMDSASENASSLTLASAAGLLALALSAWAFYSFGDLDGPEMAVCVVIFGVVRLSMRSVLRGRSTNPRG
ncbi:hypothetical protein ASF79_01955 [Agreia sp. Leaf335]|nr:hypothetical protein ASF79_01955 [Agreia sp. Leaf335]